MNDWLMLLTVSLAAWRLAYFVAREDAPFRVMAKIRARWSLGGLLTCIRCASVWSAAFALGAWYAGDVGRALVVVLAASGAAIMLGSYTGADR